MQPAATSHTNLKYVKLPINPAMLSTVHFTLASDVQQCQRASVQMLKIKQIKYVLFIQHQAVEAPYKYVSFYQAKTKHTCTFLIHSSVVRNL